MNLRSAHSGWIVLGFLCFLFSPDVLAKDSFSFAEHIAVEQNGTEVLLHQNDSVTLERKPFSIRFFLQTYDAPNRVFHAAKIAVFLDPDQVEYVSAGTSLEDTHAFGSGAGMAPQTTGFYDVLFPGPDRCHYLFYGDEDLRRVNLLERTQKWLYVEFPVKGIYFSGQDIPWSRFRLSALYLVVVSDVNQNNTLDEGEFLTFSLHFN